MQSINKKIFGIVIISFFAISATGILATALLGSIEGTASTNESSSDDGESSILSYLSYIQPTAKYLCMVAKDYSPYDVGLYKNEIVVGNMYAYVSGSSSYSAHADAYYQTGGANCGYGTDLGNIDNDYGLELYVDPAIVMDSSTNITGHFPVYLVLWECTDSCSSGCTYVGLFQDFARTGTQNQVVTHRKSVPVDPAYCGDDWDCDSLCIPRVRITNTSSKTGIKYYKYWFQIAACNNTTCTGDYAVDDDTGCFKVNWVD